MPLTFATSTVKNPASDQDFDIRWYQAGLIEFINTFFLMIVILSFTSKKDIPKPAFGGAIGLMLA